MNKEFFRIVTEEDPLEKAALMLNELDDIKVCNYLGRKSFFDNDGIRELHAKDYMNASEQITYSRHPHFLDVGIHKHDFLEMTYVYSGEYTQTVNQKKLLMKRGDFFILDTFVVHEIKRIPDDCLLINIMMKKEYFIENLLSKLADSNVLSSFLISAIYKNSLTGNYLLFKENDSKKMDVLIEEIVLELNKKQIGWNEATNSLIVLLFTEILRKNSNSTYKHNRLTNSTSVPIIDILNYIDKNYDSISLVDCATHFGIHPNYLTRLLKKHTNKTFIEIVQQLKMEKVINLLCNTNLSVVQILELTGFSNSNHFYKLFKKQFNCTPIKFRENHQV